MIRYDLVCAQGHRFDGWFGNSAAYDDQVKQQLVQCPDCGSAQVCKQLMTPSLGGVQKKLSDEATRPQFLEMMRELRKAVAENADYVGEDFAQEARRMHYMESPRRGIYGETNLDEAKSLIEEGIEIHPLPILPEDSH